MTPILIVPGYTGSGPQHWQTLWQRDLASAIRVDQRDWDRPDRDEWTGVLDGAVLVAGAPPLLVAHSLGCLTVAW